MKCEIENCNNKVEYTHVTRVIYPKNKDYGSQKFQDYFKRLCKKHSDKYQEDHKNLPIIKKNKIRVYRERYKVDENDKVI